MKKKENLQILLIDNLEIVYASQVVDMELKYLEKFETLLFSKKNKTLLVSRYFDLKYHLTRIFKIPLEEHKNCFTGKVKNLEYFYVEIPVSVLNFLEQVENHLPVKVSTLSEISQINVNFS